MATRSARAAAGDAGDWLSQPRAGGRGDPASGCRIPAGSGRRRLHRGQNLAIEYRFTNFRPELMREAAGDLVRLNVNAIFAIAPEAVAAARNATTSIAIVALDLESDPLARGYIKSLVRPGGNMTGMFLDLLELSGNRWGCSKRSFPGSLA
jgi:putative tryptophan/tyrosine transport system substrate-binding protein